MGNANSKQKPPAAQLSTTSDSSTNPPLPPHPAQVSEPALTAAIPEDHTDDDPNVSASAVAPPQDPPAKNHSLRGRFIPGKKEVQVLKVNSPEDYEDDTNQTGQSIYELKVQDSYYSTPNRPRSRAVTEQMEAAKAKKVAKAEKKAEKVAKKKSKKRQEPGQIEPGSLPWVIENAKRLGVLNLSKRSLETIPDLTFESVPGTTRVINVSANKMAQLDPRLCDYVLVQRLIANDNLLTQIPNKIARMTALKTLDLSNNNLTSLPDAFQTMRHLNHVDLSGNQLLELPDSFSELNLKVLNLSSNKFANAPLQIATMPALEELDLSNNQLSAIPSEFAAVTTLRILQLDSNNLTDFPDIIFTACVDLVKLLVRHNPLKMTTLESKVAYRNFAERRRIKCKRLLDLGILSVDELNPADT